MYASFCNPAPDTTMTKILTRIFAALCLSAGFVASALAGNLEASQGWVRWLPGDLPMAGYLVISNRGDKPVDLTHESSPDYKSVMLHRTVNKGGTAHMEMVGRLTIPAHGKVEISPGNYHLMLTHAQHPITPGDEVHLTLHFSDGSAVHTVLNVRPANQVS